MHRSEPPTHVDIEEMHGVAVELALDIAGERPTALIDFGIPGGEVGLCARDCYYDTNQGRGECEYHIQCDEVLDANQACRPAGPPVCPHCGAEFREGRPACPECGSDAETGWSREGLTGEAHGLPMDDLIRSLSGGAAGNWSMTSVRAPMPISIALSSTVTGRRYATGSR